MGVRSVKRADLDIPDDWEVAKIEDIAGRIDSGQTAPQGAEFFQKGKFPFVRVKHLSNLRNGKFVDDFDLLNEDAISKNHLKLYPKGSIIFPKSGESIRGEKKAIIPTASYVVNHLCVVVPDDDKADRLFLFYALSSVKITELLTQTTTPSVNLSDIRRIKIPLPPRVEQQEIAQILSTVDDAIQKTYDIVAKTQQLKKGLMQQLLTKGIGHTKFKETAIGEVPEAWEIARIGDLLKKQVVVEIQDGNHGELHPKTSEFVDHGIPFITANNLKYNQLDFSECVFLTKERALTLRIGFSKSGDVLLSHKGSIGLTAIVPPIQWDFLVLSPQVTYYRVNESRISKRFLYYAFQSEYFQHVLKKWSKQSTRDYIGILNQRKLTLALPTSLEEQEGIASVISAIDDKIREEQRKKQLLEELKKSLMHVLLSGKVRVKVKWSSPSLVS